MSNVARVAGQAANTLTKPLEVEDVFSTYLYSANNAGLTITNGIDLAGEGGLVWGKSRSATQNHRLYDTEGNGLYSNLTNGSFGSSGRFTANSDGFDLTASSGIVGGSGFGGPDYASWTWRKAPKFFDVVTYTGDGTTNDGSSRLISHNLGSTPGFYIVKRTDAANNWRCFHRSLGATKAIQLNGTGSAITSSGWWADVAPTDTNFSVTFNFNETNANYVVYLFAHNDSGDGEFGPDGDADIIKCGSYTGNGSTNGPEIDLGFEPQWLLIKRSDSADAWILYDSMRGIVTGGNDSFVMPQSSSAESTIPRISLTPTGFEIDSSNSDTNASGGSYIYIAIRRGTAVPESATEVFAVTTQSGSTPPAHDTGFVTDFSLRRENALSSASTIHAVDRLRGKPYLVTDGTNAETNLNNNTWDFMDGWFGSTSNDSNKYAWSWKRAPKYFDVVAYTGNSNDRAISHNLGVAPEMIWVKNRDRGDEWVVYTEPTTKDKILMLHSTSTATTSNMFNNTAPTATDFTLKGDVWVNGSGYNYIAYLFATLAGISKVGSVTHSGTTNVDCGFTSGARFVLLKRTDATGDWYVWDSVRGIVAGNDPYLLLNSTAAEVTNTDYIDPLSSGFTITSSFTAGDYIFYAIA